MLLGLKTTTSCMKSAIGALCIILILVLIQTNHTFQLIPNISTLRVKFPTGNQNVHTLNSDSVSSIPDILIFRRTRKTGSSSMLEQLLKLSAIYSYRPLYESGTHLRTLVRAASLSRNKSERLFIAEHNSISRADIRHQSAVIVDTITDGYKQITSFCRFVRKVRVTDCDRNLELCLRSPVTQAENRYRWTGRTVEDDDTYIDIPLSVEHPALSTKAIRRIFPNAILDVKKLNVANSSCSENVRLRMIYKELYKELDRQVESLRQRLLFLAGYPSSRKNESVTTAAVLDAAEVMEKEAFKKVGVTFGTYESEKAVSDEHLKLKKSQMTWALSDTGTLHLVSSRT